ncbi:hypothetical protein RIEGSTA812A_PEG_1082 [invertebrate metagenome]|uniref:Uncharacterized protein n=1 Tax=invertebrate metagenome TaxID=1711999 RepID=A0A484H6G4_9ZZZZ
MLAKRVSATALLAMATNPYYAILKGKCHTYDSLMESLYV